MGGKQKNKKREGKKDVVEHHRAAAVVKYLNLLCILSGLYMTAVGCMLVYDGVSSDVGLGFTDSDNVGMWITIIYSTILGLLVLATSLKVRLIMEQFSFVSHLLRLNKTFPLSRRESLTSKQSADAWILKVMVKRSSVCL